MSKRFILIAMVCLLVLAVCQPVLAQSETNSQAELNASQFYVATNGNDSNPGTIDRPWLTIQKAASTAQAGTTVNIRGGTYHESVSFANSGTQSSPITFRNYSGETVVIQADDWVGLLLQGVNWLVIQGLDVSGASVHGLAIRNASNNINAVFL